MTLRQRVFKAKIKDPTNKYNISETMRKSGYSDTSARSGAVRKSILKYTQDIFNPEKTKRKILKYQRKFDKDKDNTNTARMIELEARISVPELRRQDIHTDSPQQVIIVDSEGIAKKHIEAETKSNTNDISNV